MQIDPTSRLLQALLAAPPRRTEAVAFSGNQAAPQVASRQSVGNPVQSVQMLVALAGSSLEPERRRIAAEEADQAIAGLEQFHKELLAGVTNVTRLRSLRDKIRLRKQADDTQLAELQDEIEMRILVELAKHDR
jgi:hypothetical protein